MQTMVQTAVIAWEKMDTTSSSNFHFLPEHCSCTSTVLATSTRNFVIVVIVIMNEISTSSTLQQ